MSDHSLSGHSHTFTFSSTEVSLSFPSFFFFTFLFFPLFPFPDRPLCPAFTRVLVFSFLLLVLVSLQTLDDDPVPSNNNQWQSRPILEWSNQQVCLWLIAMNMAKYASEFAAKGVDGTQLLNMDSEKLKVSK